MKPRLAVLVVEDRENDAELVLLELRRGGFDLVSERVDTAEAMSGVLDRDWDVIISDWSMPRFSAMAAFALVRDRGLDLPFIIVSGTIGEETAVSAMKIGVHDFMSKGHLSRLIPAIGRELREAENRRQSRKMREQLLISERMRLVVGDLRVFSHPGEERAHGPVDVRSVVESALRMASTEIRHRAQLVRDFAEVSPVHGNEAPLGQIFLNLIVNAAQAIPEGRVSSNTITVAIRQHDAERVTVEIRDTGAGIPDDIVSRIFDPFFTTKPPGSALASASPSAIGS